MIRNRLLFLKKETIDDIEHKFLLIHHFKIDPQNPEYFKTWREVLYGNKPNIYSAFGFIDDSFKLSNSGSEAFVFLLEYPEQSCYFYFSQEKNPIYTPDNTYTGMQMKKQTCQNAVQFAGFTIHSETNTFLEGVNRTSGRVWFYSLGQKISWEGKPQIPGFIGSLEPPIREVNLYIEIENLSLLSKFHQFYSCKQIRPFHFISLSFLFFYFS